MSDWPANVSRPNVCQDNNIQDYQQLTVQQCNGVIMSAIVPQITSVPICLLNRLFKAQMKENIKAPRHWPYGGEHTGDIPAQWVSNAENVSIWWRHPSMHACKHTICSKLYPITVIMLNGQMMPVCTLIWLLNVVRYLVSAMSLVTMPFD